jgi:hypothetical protein
MPLPWWQPCTAGYSTVMGSFPTPTHNSAIRYPISWSASPLPFPRPSYGKLSPSFAPRSLACVDSDRAISNTEFFRRERRFPVYWKSRSAARRARPPRGRAIRGLAHSLRETDRQGRRHRRIAARSLWRRARRHRGDRAAAARQAALAHGARAFAARRLGRSHHLTATPTSKGLANTLQSASRTDLDRAGTRTT